MLDARPVLVDVLPAGEALEGMTPSTVLVSGPVMAIEEYHGPQRDAILHAAVHEGLAPDPDRAWELLVAEEIILGHTLDHGCVGSTTGVHTFSTPVYRVEDPETGVRAHCGLYEFGTRLGLSFGVYDDEIRRRLHRLEEQVAPALGAAVRTAGGIPLLPMMSRALRMGDELHSRTLAATHVLARTLMAPLADADVPDLHRRAATEYLATIDPLFLRLSMAAATVIATSGHGAAGSTIVTGMVMNCRSFYVRLSGSDRWFGASLPKPRGRFFAGFGVDDVVWTGGESCMTECVGLGGMAQASAPALLDYHDGSFDDLVRHNLDLYSIVRAEHPELVMPALGFRGVPFGIDAELVVQTGLTPLIDVGYAGNGVGQIGAGSVRAPLACFTKALSGGVDAAHV